MERIGDNKSGGQEGKKLLKAVKELPGGYSLGSTSGHSGPSSSCRPKETKNDTEKVPVVTGQVPSSTKKKRKYIVVARYLEPIKQKTPIINKKIPLGITPQPKNKVFKIVRQNPFYESYEKKSMLVKRTGSRDDSVINSTSKNISYKPFSTPTNLNVSTILDYDDVSCINFSVASTVACKKEVPQIKNSLMPDLISRAKSKTLKSKASNVSVLPVQQQQKVSPLEMDILYSRYLQSVLVYLSMEKKFKEQQEEDTRNLWKLTCLIEENRSKELELKHRIIYLQEKHRTYQVLTSQLEELSPLLEKIIVLQKQMKEVSVVIEDYLNQVEFKNTIVDPETLSSCLSELSAKFDQMETSSNDLENILLPTAKAINAMAESGEIEKIKLKELNSNISKLKDLTVKQLSLTIQDIQSQDIPHI